MRPYILRATAAEPHHSGICLMATSGSAGVLGLTQPKNFSSVAACCSSCGRQSRPVLGSTEHVEVGNPSLHLRARAGPIHSKFWMANARGRPKASTRQSTSVSKHLQRKIFEKNKSSFLIGLIPAQRRIQALCDEDLNGLCQVAKEIVSPFRELSISLAT